MHLYEKKAYWLTRLMRRRIVSVTYTGLGMRGLLDGVFSEQILMNSPIHSTSRATNITNAYQ